nr:class I SAM-dependent methyltransferase [Auraticoccus cholistanensis]
MVRERRPGLVVECGSGTSTLWLGHAVRQLGHGRIVALEHAPEYAEHVRSMIRRHGLQEWATVVDAPLVTRQVDGEERVWYSAHGTNDLQDIDVLVVDGPPKAVGDLARFPALPLLENQLAADAVVILDDAGREDERRVVDRWIARNPRIKKFPYSERRQVVLTDVSASTMGN